MSNPYADSTFSTTPAEMADIIEKAMSRIVATGKEYRIGEQWWKAEDLPRLKELWLMYKEMAGRASGPARNLVQFGNKREAVSE